MAKVRATLCLAGRLAARGAREDWLSGAVGEGGTLALVKFCEDLRLTGRLTAESGGRQHWAEFRGGELVQAGSEAAGEDALDTLLAVCFGTYLIQQKRLSPEARFHLGSVMTLTLLKRTHLRLCRER